MSCPIPAGLHGSLALIRHPKAREWEWLLRWSDERGQFETLTAARLESESFREALDREIAWQLDLRRSKDYIISSMARLHMEETFALPGDEHAHDYLIEAFVVDPYGNQLPSQVEQLSEWSWIAADEIYAGKTKTGKQIDTRLSALVNKYELFSAHRDHDQ